MLKIHVYADQMNLVWVTLVKYSLSDIKNLDFSCSNIKFVFLAKYLPSKLAYIQSTPNK